ncbi:hypothetical protein SKAU_G00071900 [Synaphobranchus kaupii]|uniref:Uncharacterized protein n=1 Tax=Synaphobranchus kaupii TaxID=118154 RepID=A0A9Q1G8I2_SYNKA|nr:hypothetical protein SKAU_G00071900 [Synaphobranchus kaupii]
MASMSTKLAPLHGNDRGDYGSSDIHMFRNMDRLGPVINCAVGKLSGAPKLTHTLTKRRANPGTQYLQDKSKEMKGLERSCIVDGSTYSSFISREHDPKMTRLGIEHNIRDIDISGRNFMLDTKWTGHRTESKYDFRERRLPKPNSFIPPLPRDYQVHRSNHVNRFMLHKDLSHSSSKPFAIGSYEAYDLTSMPEIVSPVTVQSLCGKPSFSTDTHINRPGGNNRTPGLFRIGANKKSYTYIDPVCGASASFVVRLSEMASLEGETMRQENLKKLKKTKRLDS